MFSGKSSVLLWIGIMALAQCLESFASVEAGKNGYNSAGEKVLSRRRRYLIFPEGSSFQMGVYFLFIATKLKFINIQSFKLCIIALLFNHNIGCIPPILK